MATTMTTCDDNGDGDDNDTDDNSNTHQDPLTTAYVLPLTANVAEYDLPLFK